MPCIVNIWGTGINPINVTKIVEGTEEREVRRDGQILSKTFVRGVYIHLVGDDAPVFFGAASDDPVAQANLLQGVIDGLNVAWNSKGPKIQEDKPKPV
jgi:hypothetical protein